MRRVALAVLCALALVASACGDDGEPTYSVEELSDAVVLESEAPKGTVRVDEASGQVDLDRFAVDDADRRALRENKFQGAHQAVFATPGLQLPGVGGGGQPPPDARVVSSFAAVFEDVAGARKMFDFYVDDWLPSRLEGEEDLPDPDFGQDSFGTRFSSFVLAPYPGVLYLWRDDNALFGVLRASPERLDATPGQVLALGDAMETRAQED